MGLSVNLLVLPHWRSLKETGYAALRTASTVAVRDEDGVPLFELRQHRCGLGRDNNAAFAHSPNTRDRMHSLAETNRSVIAVGVDVVKDAAIAFEHAGIAVRAQWF
jgi:hypothetical protein